ncbi:MAG: type VI secretion system protein TssA [Rhodospirillaceae bacterium]
MTPPASAAAVGVPLPDLSGVTEPLPGAAPAGPSLRYLPVYDAIREARRQDDASLPQGVWQTEHKRADWAEVIRLCVDVLLHQSKDLQVACWLVEALVYRHSFAGFAPGLRMVGGLCRAFWADGLHPINDNGDYNARFAPLEWLDGKLSHLLCLQPVMRANKQAEVEYSYSDYRNAQRLGVAGARDAAVMEQARAAGKILPGDIEASTAATLATVLRGYFHDLALAIEETAALASTLNGLSGNTAPGMVGLRNRLSEIQGWIHTALLTKGEPPVVIPPAVEDDEQSEQDEIMYRKVDYRGDGPITTREEAYSLVATAAEYLLRTEPHSPTPYLLQRAILWGNMPLHEILIEISRGRNDLSVVIDFLGFNSSDTSKASGRS